MNSQERAALNERSQAILEEILLDPTVRQLLREGTRPPLVTEWMCGEA